MCVYIVNTLQLSSGLDMMLVKSVHVFMLVRGIKYFWVNYADTMHVFPKSQGFE